MPVQVIAGLGNPGSQYEGTRHNVGFDLVDHISSKAGSEWKLEKRFDSLVSQVNICGKPCMLVKPQMYMNESGRALGALSRFKRIPASDFLVVYDEYQIPVGEVKVSCKGGNGGHNGVSSLISHLGDDWIRMRIGIAPERPRSVDMKVFVLGKFAPNEKEVYLATIPHFAECVNLIVSRGVQLAMNQVNQRKKKSKPNEQAQL
jgi:PTH1 family peptidyl-tRNA hydrolase